MGADHVQQMFLALDLYSRMTLRLSLEKYRDERGVIILDRDQALDYLIDLGDSQSLDFAKSTLCGAIIQVAYSGIVQFSKNLVIPESCKEMGVKNESKSLKFCTGRIVHDLPIGLYIYAARIQYNHWEEGFPTNLVAKNVFIHLIRIHYEDPVFDLAYEMDWPIPRPITHHVLLLELKWREYDNYLEDMNEMIGE